MTDQLTCGKRPCSSCPYRKDVPSGIWHPEEYDKLTSYDGEMFAQSHAVFMCHQQNGKLCAGWVATHGPNNLLALRFAAIGRRVDPAVFEYQTDVEVFSSGKEARDHGLKDFHTPGAAAKRKMRKLINQQERRLRR